MLNEEMPLRIAHDISEDLQINIESLPDVRIVVNFEIKTRIL